MIDLLFYMILEEIHQLIELFWVINPMQYVGILKNL